MEESLKQDGRVLSDEQIVQAFNRVQVRYSSFGGPLNAVLKFAREIEHAALAHPSEPAPAEPTEIAGRLRQRAAGPMANQDDAKLMLAAADECDRFYGGMMAWKRTAEKKDRDWNAERMARVDDRCVARAAASQAAPAKPVVEWVNEEQGFQYLIPGRLPDGTQLYTAAPATVASDAKATLGAIGQAPTALPKSNDGKEQDAFEEWAASNRYDMTVHPLHWLFLNERTNAARQGWKGALGYVSKVIESAAPADHSRAAKVALDTIDPEARDA